MTLITNLPMQLPPGWRHDNQPTSDGSNTYMLFRENPPAPAVLRVDPNGHPIVYPTWNSIIAEAWRLEIDRTRSRIEYEIRLANGKRDRQRNQQAFNAATQLVDSWRDKLDDLNQDPVGYIRREQGKDATVASPTNGKGTS